MNNDLGFLIIFIVLPTVLIVSGFWLILIVRSDLRLRATAEASTSADETGDDLEPQPNEPLEEPASPIPTGGTADLPAPGFIVDGVAAPVPQRASDAPDDDIEEFWTPEPDPAPEVEVDPAPVDAPPKAGAPDVDEPVEAVSGDTANLPEKWEVELDEGADPPAREDESSDERPQRQPEARMVPSTEHVKRRTGQTKRRAPKLARSVARDEDAVESPDSS